MNQMVITLSDSYWNSMSDRHGRGAPLIESHTLRPLFGGLEEAFSASVTELDEKVLKFFPTLGFALARPAGRLWQGRWTS